ncbi:protease inhibitor Inh/omp19 family protein [Ancylobacter amanitiformis]|uniref:Alkaline proteinase inhibitor/ Outer membrane lipoprotein Omp19 domain-containing protein n=1 Tax=Ancylobacter amanitiformis TaxID=217069 RepID=A0ABU0LNZ5_9HYPH|nr:protease inhibitor Inh/omp19 family protein [Ancylobacter amanitiformis]MDQ0510406.1 hypothetical protein [Ancylobacter amanitiformis]
MPQAHGPLISSRLLGKIAPALFAAALLVSTLGSSAGAQGAGSGTPAEAAGQLADAYRLTNADGDRVCPLTLSVKRAKEAPRGAAASGPGAAAPLGASFAIDFDRPACAAAILFSADIASWAPGAGNSIHLLNGAGQLVAEFTEGVGGNWEALREGDGVYFLVNPRLADSATTQPGDLVGLWELADATGTPACRVRLAEETLKPGVYRLAPDPACAALLGRTLPDRWRLDGGDLVLETAGGNRVRFASSEDGAWAKVPEDSRPLLLSRAP